MGVIVTRFFCSVILMPTSLKREQTLALWLSHQHALGGLRSLLRTLRTIDGCCHSVPCFRCWSTPATFQNNRRACIYLLLRVKLTPSSAAHTGINLHNQAFLWVQCEKPTGVGLESHEANRQPAAAAVIWRLESCSLWSLEEALSSGQQAFDSSLQYLML